MVPVFETGENGRPTIIVIHEVFGLNDHIRDVAERFAAQGFHAVAPDLFFREGGGVWPDAPLPDLLTFLSTVPDDRVLEDLGSVRETLPTGVGVGVIGFCMGGAYALMLSCVRQDLAAAADFYGRVRYATLTPQKPKSPIDYVGTLGCPLLGVFGEADEGIPVADIEALHARLSELDKDVRVYTYPDAGHGFFNDTREAYSPDAAADAWDRTITFFKKHLT